jgi:hypothetical protein
MAQGQEPSESVRVSVVEVEFVRRLVVAAATLTIAVLESDEGLVCSEVVERAKDVQALYAELVG